MMGKSQDAGEVGKPNTNRQKGQTKPSSSPPNILNTDPPHPLIQEGDLGGYQITSMDQKMIAYLKENSYVTMMVPSNDSV